MKKEYLDLRLLERPQSGATLITLEELVQRQKKERQEYLEYLQTVLKESASRREAARKLGISPSNLQYYLETHEASA